MSDKKGTKLLKDIYLEILNEHTGMTGMTPQMGMLVIEPEIEDKQHGCPWGAKGCTCGGCPDCKEHNHNHESDPSEIDLALSNIDQISNALEELYNIIEDSESLEGWVASKITLAADYITRVHDYLSFENKDKVGDKCGCSNQYNLGYEDV